MATELSLLSGMKYGLISVGYAAVARRSGSSGEFLGLGDWVRARNDH